MESKSGNWRENRKKKKVEEEEEELMKLFLCLVKLFSFLLIFVLSDLGLYYF